MGKIAPGQAQYTLLCADDGGVVDDLIVYLRSDEDLLLVPNAANCATVTAILAVAVPAGVEVVDRHDDFALIAVQGTESDEVLGEAGLPVGHDYMSFVEVEPRRGCGDSLPDRLYGRAWVRADRPDPPRRRSGTR